MKFGLLSSLSLYLGSHILGFYLQIPELKVLLGVGENSPPQIDTAEKHMSLAITVISFYPANRGYPPNFSTVCIFLLPHVGWPSATSDGRKPYRARS